MIGLGFRARIQSLESAKRTGKREKRRRRKPVPYFADHYSGKKWRSVSVILLHEHFKRVCHLMNCVRRLDFKHLGQIAIGDRISATGKLLQILPYSFR